MNKKTNLKTHPQFLLVKKTETEKITLKYIKCKKFGTTLFSDNLMVQMY